MTRWHSFSCASPDIELGEDRAPKCKACGQSCPPVEQLILERAETNSAWGVPPDKPLGEMQLWWPESVPYERNGVRVQVSQKTSVEQYTPADAMPRMPSSLLYQQTLRSDQFRLVYLSAVPDPDYPIHVTLEDYADHEHPEYECASYTWGGEDGDSTPCRPVYVGPYWDVLLQTKNCSSMLRFLRPWRGTRAMWVDAICINQQSLTEKSTQVAKMKSLYEMCSSVIVYLGEDIATRTRGHPTTRSLEALGEANPISPPNLLVQASPFSLDKLLSRQYFRRLWVIQELVACPRAVIRVGNVNFIAHAGIMARTFSTHNESFKSAHWLSHLGQGSILERREEVSGSSPISDVLSILKLTARSQASVSQNSTLQTPARESSVVEMKVCSQCESLKTASNGRAIPSDWGVYDELWAKRPS
jgi:hypothetical protein